MSLYVIKSDYLADALSRGSIYDDEGELAAPAVPYPMNYRCADRGHHRFESVMRSNCADCGIDNPDWCF